MVELAEQIPLESSVHVEGAVLPRHEGMQNPDMATGSIEIHPSQVLVTGICETRPPINVSIETQIDSQRPASGAGGDAGESARWGLLPLPSDTAVKG